MAKESVCTTQHVSKSLIYRRASFKGQGAPCFLTRERRGFFLQAGWAGHSHALNSKLPLSCFVPGCVSGGCITLHRQDADLCMCVWSLMQKCPETFKRSLSHSVMLPKGCLHWENVIPWWVTGRCHCWKVSAQHIPEQPSFTPHQGSRMQELFFRENVKQELEIGLRIHPCSDYKGLYICLDVTGMFQVWFSWLSNSHWQCGNHGSVGVLGLLLAVKPEQTQAWEPVQLTLGITKAPGPPSMSGQTRKARWLYHWHLTPALSTRSPLRGSAPCTRNRDHDTFPPAFVCLACLAGCSWKRSAPCGVFVQSFVHPALIAVGALECHWVRVSRDVWTLLEASACAALRWWIRLVLGRLECSQISL